MRIISLVTVKCLPKEGKEGPEDQRGSKGSSWSRVSQAHEIRRMEE
jgi:hypothetical protein